MNLFQELRARRVPQITSGYIVGGWGLIQFFDFLEGRMAVSPNLVNLVGVGLVVLLPSVIMLAWVHGRPGKDTWGRTPKVILASNILAMFMLLGFLFRGQDLGNITKTIEVQDENGAVSERVVPKNQFRHRVLLFYPENIGDESDNWARETLNTLQAMDLNQDVFVEAVIPMGIVSLLKDVGNEDGFGLSRPLKRKLVKEGHLPFFITSTLEFKDDVWIFSSELHESNSGRVLSKRTTEAPDLFTLTDLTSREIREDLGIPSAHLESSEDLPVVDLSSTDIEAVKSHVQGLLAVTFENDWERSAPLFDDAVARDEGFAMAQFMRFAVYQTLGEKEKSEEAIAVAMENLFRVTERTRFMIKAQYYYNVKQDSDKADAVLKMWNQIYPNDVEALSMIAIFSFVHQDLHATIDAYKKILAIDPSQVKLIRQMANCYKALGENEKAEEYYLSFVEKFPTDTKGYRDLANFYSHVGQLDQAREILEKAQLVDPGELDLMLGLIDLDIKLGKYQQAKDVLNTQLKRAKTERDKLGILTRQMDMASILGHSEELLQIIESYHSSMREIQNPLQADLVYSALLPLASHAGLSEQVLERLDTLSSQVPDPFNKLIGIGRSWVLIDLGRVDEAKADLDEASALVDAFKFETYKSTIAIIRGSAAEKTGDLPLAVEQYKIAIDLSLTVQPISRIRYARALRKNNQLEEAETVLNEALKQNPVHPELHLELAEVLFSRDMEQKALEHLQIAEKAWSGAHESYPPAKRAIKLAGQIN